MKQKKYNREIGMDGMQIKIGSGSHAYTTGAGVFGSKFLLSIPSASHKHSFYANDIKIS